MHYCASVSDNDNIYELTFVGRKPVGQVTLVLQHGGLGFVYLGLKCGLAFFFWSLMYRTFPAFC